VGTYIHSGQKVSFSIQKSEGIHGEQDRSPLELTFGSKKFELIPFDNGKWTLWTEDLMFQYFVFEWENSKKGCYLKLSFENASAPIVFFDKLPS
jgi:hypothetical protein